MLRLMVTFHIQCLQTVHKQHAPTYRLRHPVLMCISQFSSRMSKHFAPCSSVRAMQRFKKEENKSTSGTKQSFPVPVLRCVPSILRTGANARRSTSLQKNSRQTRDSTLFQSFRIPVRMREDRRMQGRKNPDKPELAHYVIKPAAETAEGIAR